MKFILTLLILMLATSAFAQTEAAITFRWTQPDTTVAGTPLGDGWLSGYNVYIATQADTTFYGLVPAPAAIADTASAVIFLQLGRPSAIRVSAVDQWDTEGLLSEWSDTTIVIPEQAVGPGKPLSVEN